MAISKIILNGVTQMDVTQDTVASSNLLSGYTATKNDGTKVNGAYVPPSAPTLQTKSVSYTPTESAQSEKVTADSGYDGLDEVNVSVGAISNTYVGTGITRRSSTDLTRDAYTINVPAGYYAENASRTVERTVHATPTVSINEATGLITAKHTQNQGWVEGSGSGADSTVKTLQLSTQAAKTITPTESSQTAVATNVYTTGEVTVDAIPSDYIGSGITIRSSTDLTASGATVTVPAGYYSAQASKSVASGTAGTPTASKGTVSNHSVSVTPSVTNTTGYISGGTKTGTAVTVSASELVSGTKTITENGTTDVTNYASVNVDISFSTIYTGTTDPSSSLGVNGDIYLKVVG